MSIIFTDVTVVSINMVLTVESLLFPQKIVGNDRYSASSSVNILSGSQTWADSNKLYVYIDIWIIL